MVTDTFDWLSSIKEGSASSAAQKPCNARIQSKQAFGNGIGACLAVHKHFESSLSQEMFVLQLCHFMQTVALCVRLLSLAVGNAVVFLFYFGAMPCKLVLFCTQIRAIFHAGACYVSCRFVPRIPAESCSRECFCLSLLHHSALTVRTQISLTQSDTSK